MYAINSVEVAEMCCVSGFFRFWQVQFINAVWVDVFLVNGA
jgi:hypothetical protein